MRKLTTDDIPYELVDIAVPTDFGFSSFKEKQELALRVYHTAKAGELLYMWYMPGGYKVDELEELNPGIELIVFDS